MKKAQNLGTHTTSQVAWEGHCGITSAIFYATEVNTEIILWDQEVEIADGTELLHVVLSTDTFSFIPLKSKSVENGIYVEIKSGAGGVIIDIEP